MNEVELSGNLYSALQHFEKPDPRLTLTAPVDGQKPLWKSADNSREGPGLGCSLRNFTGLFLRFRCSSRARRFSTAASRSSPRLRALFHGCFAALCFRKVLSGVAKGADVVILTGVGLFQPESRPLPLKCD